MIGASLQTTKRTQVYKSVFPTLTDSNKIYRVYLTSPKESTTKFSGVPTEICISYSR